MSPASTGIAIMDPTPATPSAVPIKRSLFTAWPYSVQLAVAILLAMGVGFLISRAFASDPQREAPATDSGDGDRVRLDVNRATQAELALLPGVGPSKAQSIEEYRRQHGDFRSIDDLRNVPGIGPKTLEKIHPSLFVGGILRCFAPW